MIDHCSEMKIALLSLPAFLSLDHWNTTKSVSPVFKKLQFVSVVYRALQLQFGQANTSLVEPISDVELTNKNCGHY